MDFRNLSYFQMVCKLGSFTKAAEYFNISQPSVTVAIQKLEEEMGVKLLERSQKKVSLTKAGKVFLNRTEVILNKVENLAIEMNEFQSSKKETIRIGIPPMLGSYLLPKILTEFTEHHSHVELCVYEIGSNKIKELLEFKELDLGIIILKMTSPLFEVEPLKLGEIKLILPPNHPLSKHSVVPFELLETEQFVLMSKALHQIIMNECKKHRITPKIVHKSAQFSTIQSLVSSGIGISFFPDIMTRNITNVISRSLAEPLHITTGVVWRKDKLISSSQQKLIEFIKQISKD